MTTKILGKKRSRREELTCNELNTAKIYRNAKECVLTARTPKIQEMPSMGKSTATAFAVSLETKQETTTFTSLAFSRGTILIILIDIWSDQESKLTHLTALASP